MAVGALIPRQDVACPLALCPHAIVTRKAACLDLAVVDVGHAPLRHGMAVAAGIAGGRMVLRLSLRQSTIMALLADRGDAFEYSTKMAGLAGN